MAEKPCHNIETPLIVIAGNGVFAFTTTGVIKFKISYVNPFLVQKVLFTSKSGVSHRVY
jgi:hypothetical protein